MNVDEIYMRRALQLAGCGRGHTAPNPMVGAVIVREGVIVGEGYHRRCGEGHAEVNAVASVRDKRLLAGSTIYVTLEPCSHYGKTPPCAKLLIESGFGRVVVGVEDPFPAVSGRGIRMLREAGIEVEVGVLRQECLDLNRAFMTAQLQQRPYIVLKWAQSRDGFIDRWRTSAQVPPVALSDEVNRLRVHRLRSECDAILVGANTALLDRPSLSVRYWCERSTLKICVDPHRRVPTDVPMLSEVSTAWHIVEPMTPQEIAAALSARKIQSLLVEGGRQTLQRFIDAGCWDEIQVEVTPLELQDGVPCPQVGPSVSIEVSRCGTSKLLVYRPVAHA